MKQEEALEILKMGHNVFLTGAAGSGKTFLLNKYIDYLKNKGKGVAVTASTGIAATHMNGITIHSWSGLGIRDTLTAGDFRKMLNRPYLRKRFQKVGVLIIDEASMLHNWQFDLINQICQAFRENKKSFGGMQIICSGDFFQLPPVSRGEKAKFIIESAVWQEMDMKICYLEEQYRQSDDQLLRLLNYIRSGRPEEATVLLSEATRDIVPDKTFATTKFFTHNVDVDELNNKELKKLAGREFNYEMRVHGSRHFADILKRGCLAPENLVLKKGAKVMFVKNNFDEGYVNGTLGEVVGFGEYDWPIVKTVDGKHIFARPESWKIEEDGTVKVEVEQLPLRLAWAITVHKSQGMTLDEAEIDLSRSFVEGMGYVALSRIRSIKGLYLRGINKMAFLVNEDILFLDNNLREKSEEARSKLRVLTREQILKKQDYFLQSLPGQHHQKKKSTYDQTKELLARKLSIKEMAQERGMTENTIIGHLEKIIDQDAGVKLEYLFSGFLNRDCLNRIRRAFAKSDDWKLAPVRAIFGEEFSYDELRLARLLLRSQTLR